MVANKRIIKIILSLQKKIDNRISIFIEEILDKDKTISIQCLDEIRKSLHRTIDEDFDFINRVLGEEN